ncbi:putative quinol monooxygenase [Actinoplanes sp. NPDC004185]
MVETTKPGVLLKMRARTGEGDELAKFITDLHYVEDADGPVDWLVARDDQEPEVLWITEFYRDQSSFDRHYAASNEEIEKRHDRVIELLAEPPTRVLVHPVASSS